MKKNILVLSDTTRGGEWMAILGLVNAVKSLSGSYSFSLVGIGNTGKIGGESKLFSDIILVKTLTHADPPFSFVKKLIKDVQNVSRAINQKYRKNDQIDAILISHYLMLYPILLNTKLRKVKRIYAFHGQKSALYLKGKELNYREMLVKILERVSLFLSPIIITPSIAGVKKIRSMLGLFGHKKKIIIIPNCYPREFIRLIPKINPDKYRNLLGIPDNSKVILYCGRLSKYKGLENLVEAFSLFSRKYDKFRLIIAGPKDNIDKELKYYLDLKIRSKNLKQKIQYVFDSSTEQLIALYKIADLTILPSELEISPLVLPESLLCGTPVMGTNVGDMKDTFDKIDPALLLRNNSVWEIFTKLINYFSMPLRQVHKIRKIISELKFTNQTEKSVKIVVQLFNK